MSCCLYTCLGIFALLLIAAKKFKSVEYVLRLIGAGLLIQVSYIFPLFFFPFRPFDYRNATFSCWFARNVGKHLDIRYKVHGAEHLLEGGGVVILNHQSFMDVLIFPYLWNHLGPCSTIAKKEIIYLFPNIGLSIWSYGNIFIDRSNKAAAVRSIEKASAAINKDGKKLIFFPEGTRSKTDVLKPFKSGAFVTAFNNKCKVFPVVVSKLTYFDHKRWECVPKETQISCLEAIDTTKFSDHKELMRHCQEIMQKEYDRLNGRVVDSNNINNCSSVSDKKEE